MGVFRSLFTKGRLKKTYKKLCRDDGVYLLLYCMRGSRAQRTLIRYYKFFTDSWLHCRCGRWRTGRYCGHLPKRLSQGHRSLVGEEQG
ncbi:hypothetical protein BDR07DRAFT_875545 [Suillus spraguei]|nr:hypothetical protein BDR07DRAFT_875545 [Suillus spraguei]